MRERVRELHALYCYERERERKREKGRERERKREREMTLNNKLDLRDTFKRNEISKRIVNIVKVIEIPVITGLTQ